MQGGIPPETGHNALPFSVARKGVKHQQCKEPATEKSTSAAAAVFKLFPLFNSALEKESGLLRKVFIPLRNQLEVAGQFLAKDLITVLPRKQHIHELLYLSKHGIRISRIKDFFRILTIQPQSCAPVAYI